MTKVRVISKKKTSQTFVKPTSEDFQLSHLSARPKQESCPVFGSSTAWSHPISTPTKICSGGTCDVAHLSTLDILDTHREHAEKCSFFFWSTFQNSMRFQRLNVYNVYTSTHAETKQNTLIFWKPPAYQLPHTCQRICRGHVFVKAFGWSWHTKRRNAKRTETKKRRMSLHPACLRSGRKSQNARWVLP